MGQEPRWFDIKYNGLSYEEKRRQYDRDVALYEQKEQIELARREQEANAERIVQATKKAEQDRFNNQLALEVLRQNNENIMRYHKLCDDLGMDYNDIIEFKEWLNNLTPRQIAEHKEVLEKVQNFIYTNQIKELSNNNEEAREKIEDNKIKLKRTDYFEVPGVKDNYGSQLYASPKRLNEMIEENKSLIPFCRNIIIVVTIIAFATLITSFKIDGDLSNSIKLLLQLIFGFGILLNTILLNRFVKLKNRLRLMKKKFNDNQEYQNKLTKEIEYLSEKLEKQEENLSNLLAERNKALEKDNDYQRLMPKYEEAMLWVNEGYTPNKKLFYNFRVEHYNMDIEMLFKKLGIELEKIKKEDIKKEGKVKDYLEFIDNAITED